MQGRTGVVTLEKRQDAGWSEIGREEVTLNEDASAKRVTFKLTPEVVGEIELRASIADFGDELTDADNIATHAMKIVRQQIRVLLIAGNPAPEVQFMRNALLRDTGLEFACWLQSAGSGYEQMGTQPIRRLPVNRQELDQYDVRDPVRSRHAGPRTRLARADQPVRWHVGRRADLCRRRNAHPQLVRRRGQRQWHFRKCRNRHRGRRHRRQQLAEADAGRGRSGLVQVECRSRARAPASPGIWNLRPRARSTRFFSSIQTRPSNREILASLPGMYWHFPVTRAKPGATVLARHGDPRMRNAFGRQVLLAMHRYGPGHVGVFGFRQHVSLALSARRILRRLLGPPGRSHRPQQGAGRSLPVHALQRQGELPHRRADRDSRQGH